MKLKKLLKLTDYKIYHCCSFLWTCYGDNCTSFDFVSDDSISIGSVVDLESQKVREITCCFYDLNAAFRWIDPDFVKAHQKEAKKRGCEENQAWDAVQYVDVPKDSIEILVKQMINRRVDNDQK